MQFVDKHDPKIPSSDNWRTKVSPIPSFLQDADKEDLFPTDEQDKGSPIMKGILYTILTATIGVLVGYLVSYLMRSPQASTIQALEELASSVRTQSDTILAVGKTAAGKGGAKSNANTAAPAANKAAAKSAPATPPTAEASKSAAVATAPPPAPVIPAPPGVSTASAGDKPKDPAPAAAAAATPAATPATKPAPAAKKPVPQGPVFLKGTNPYGPPPLMEQDIFDASSTLRVEYDPSTPKSPPPYEPHTVDAPTFQQLLQEPATTSPQPNFHVQLGAFNSRLNASQFANRLQEKGYEVNIYEGRTKNHGEWYFVRLDKTFDHVAALETAKNIQTTEKFSPMVVQPTDTEKKLR